MHSCKEKLLEANSGKQCDRSVFFSMVLVRQGVGKTDFWRMIHVNRKQEIKMEMEAENRKDYST